MTSCRTSYITLSLYPHEKEFLEALALAQEKKPSVFARETLLKVLKHSRAPREPIAKENRKFYMFLAEVQKLLLDDKCVEAIESIKEYQRTLLSR